MSSNDFLNWNSSWLALKSVRNLPLGLIQTESALTEDFREAEKNIFPVKRFSY